MPSPRQALIGVAACLAIAVLASASPNHFVAISGSAEMAYTRQEAVSVPGSQGHMLLLGQTRGINRNTGPDDYFADAETQNHETADLSPGNGVHQGYFTMAKGADTVVAQWHGKVSMTQGPSQRPNTTFAGTWKYVRGTGGYTGIQGSGTYKGAFLSKDRYTVEWSGKYIK
jgi:hypothetical protein